MDFLLDSQENIGCRDLLILFWVISAHMNSQIVGFSKWDYPHPPSPGKKDKKPWYDVEGANLALCEDFYGAIDRYKEAAVNSETDFRESSTFA